MLFPFDHKITQNTRKIISVHIFTSNHFHSSHNTVWALSQQRTPQTELQFDDPHSIGLVNRNTAPISSIVAPCRSHRSCRSQHRADQAKIDSNAAQSRLRRSISPSPPPRDLASKSNPITSLSSFFSQFDQIWWIFFSRFCFFCGSVWLVGKCECGIGLNWITLTFSFDAVEWLIKFSLLLFFLFWLQSLIFRKTKSIFCKMFERTKHRNWFSVKQIWGNQTAWIHFPFPKIAFPENILHEPNTT